LKTSTISGQTLIKGNRIPFIVFPIRDTRGNHPGLLVFTSDFSRRASEDRCGGTRGTTGDFLMFEPRRFERVFDGLDHLDDSLFALFTIRGVSDEADVPASLGYMFGLGGLDASVG
jgi:hypothetical protein